MTERVVFRVVDQSMCHVCWILTKNSVHWGVTPQPGIFFFYGGHFEKKKSHFSFSFYPISNLKKKKSCSAIRAAILKKKKSHFSFLFFILHNFKNFEKKSKFLKMCQIYIPKNKISLDDIIRAHLEPCSNRLGWNGTKY